MEFAFNFTSDQVKQVHGWSVVTPARRSCIRFCKRGNDGELDIINRPREEWGTLSDIADIVRSRIGCALKHASWQWLTKIGEKENVLLNMKDSVLCYLSVMLTSRAETLILEFIFSHWNDYYIESFAKCLPPGNLVYYIGSDNFSHQNPSITFINLPFVRSLNFAVISGLVLIRYISRLSIKFKESSVM